MVSNRSHAMGQDRAMAFDDEDIVTGEAVAIEVSAASFGSRMVGAAIDIFAIGMVLIFLFMGVGMAIGTRVVDEAMAGALLILVIVVALVGVPTLIETLTRGRSLGKMVMGLQIVRDDGGPIHFRHAFIRALVGVGEIWLFAGMVAVLVSLFNKRGKRLGDLLAGTYSAGIRAAQRTPPVVMPPELAPWVSQADIRRLPDGLALQVRSFLSRTDKLHGGSRQRLGMELASEVEKYVAPAPPPGTHPERFLAAVSAERRDREFNVLGREKQRTVQQAHAATRLPFDLG